LKIDGGDELFSSHDDDPPFLTTSWPAANCERTRHLTLARGHDGRLGFRNDDADYFDAAQYGVGFRGSLEHFSYKFLKGNS
jgi:hypothetical protein